MINNVQIGINLELLGMSDNELLKLVNKINNGNRKLSFEELEKIFYISNRDYYISSIELPDLNENDFKIKIAKIEING